MIFLSFLKYVETATRHSEAEVRMMVSTLYVDLDVELYSIEHMASKRSENRIYM